MANANGHKENALGKLTNCEKFTSLYFYDFSYLGEVTVSPTATGWPSKCLNKYIALILA